MHATENDATDSLQFSARYWRSIDRHMHASKLCMHIQAATATVSLNTVAAAARASQQLGKVYFRELWLAESFQFPPKYRTLCGFFRCRLSGDG